MPSSGDPPLCLSQTPRNLIVFNTTSFAHRSVVKIPLAPNSSRRSCRRRRMAALATRWWIVHREGALRCWLGCTLTVCFQLVCSARPLVLSLFQCLCSSQLPAQDWITLFWDILALNLQSLKDASPLEWVSISKPIFDVNRSLEELVPEGRTGGLIVQDRPSYCDGWGETQSLPVRYHLLITFWLSQTSKCTTWRRLSDLNFPMCPSPLKVLCMHLLLLKLNMGRALPMWR